MNFEEILIVFAESSVPDTQTILHRPNNLANCAHALMGLLSMCTDEGIRTHIYSSNYDYSLRRRTRLCRHLFCDLTQIRTGVLSLGNSRSIQLNYKTIMLTLIYQILWQIQFLAYNFHHLQLVFVLQAIQPLFQTHHQYNRINPLLLNHSQ
jgi:hypothetical protein